MSNSLSENSISSLHSSCVLPEVKVICECYMNLSLNFDFPDSWFMLDFRLLSFCQLEETNLPG